MPYQVIKMDETNVYTNKLSKSSCFPWKNSKSCDWV
jgi:hypothetical protein